MIGEDGGKKRGRVHEGNLWLLRCLKADMSGGGDEEAAPLDERPKAELA